MTGRPSTYTEEMGDLICDKITEGNSLNKLCKMEGFPQPSTVYVWLDRFPSFAEKYARAREAATEGMLEDILEIADDRSIDPNDKRVRIDARKWAMGKLKPKKYGDKATLEHSGPDGAPIAVNSTVGLAVAAVRELRGMRMDKGALPAADAPEALPAPSGDDLL